MSVGVSTGILKPVEAKTALTEAYLIAKFGGNDDQLDLAVSATADALVGIFQDKAAAKGKVNVMLTGISYVKTGAAVARGDYLTADGSGKATPTTTAKNYFVGLAMATGASGDIIPVLLAQSLL